jgi:hypothetical protein
MIIKNVTPTTNSAKKIFHFRGAGTRRQERKKEIQGLQLSIDDKSKAIHLHNAYATGLRYDNKNIKVGIKFSLTFQTSQGEHMAATTYKLLGLRFTQTAE